MYVALHEVSHIATKSIGHNDEFWNNFKFMITEAKEINIYNPVNYQKEPARYCGMNISDNPYFDLK
jgi:predicted metal-dependent hydrolase